ncbi:hypothetical protein LTS10_009720 [Elasticomyces elasticus]|nr:hypothetical protein LTS10_009720 [Elasticomyces elasticus]
MSGDHLGMDRCNCDGCSVLRTAWSEASLIYENVREPALVRKAAAATGGKLDLLLELLHREHTPHCYKIKDEGYHSLRDSGRSEEGPPTGWDDCDQVLSTSAESSMEMSSQNEVEIKDQVNESLPNAELEQGSVKVMVCDHCRGHGVSCGDESAVCEQCELSETACVHRLCKISPSSREHCPVPDCSYAHSDHLPEDNLYDVNDYIILPGALPEPLSYGPVPPIILWDYCTMSEQNESRSGAKQRQMDVLRAIVAHVARGAGELANTTAWCGQRCGTGPTLEEIREHEEEEKQLVLETEKEERAAWRIMMRQGADVMAEIEHEGLLERVRGCDCLSCFDLRFG